MSTPVQHLPQGNAPTSAKLDDDPVVTDVIQEMEMEFNSKHQPQKQQPHQQASQIIPSVPAYHQPMVVTTTIAKPHSEASWLDSDLAKRAAAAAIIALFVFYPADLSALYQRFSILNSLADYDRVIRALVLALVLYIVFWKLDI